MLTLISLITFASASTLNAPAFDSRAAAPSLSLQVESGETLSHFAQWSGLSVQTIASESGLDVNTPLSIGSMVRLPLSKEAAELVAAARETFHDQRYSDWVGDRYEMHQMVTVQLGQTAGEIAWEHDADVWQLQMLNPGVDLESLRPGQELVVPYLEVELGC